MASLGKALKSLPPEQLRTTETIKLIVGCWVKLLYKMGPVDVDGCGGGVASVALLSLLDQSDIPQNGRVLYLEKELSCHRDGSHPQSQAHPYIVLVSYDLLNLSTQLRQPLSCASYATLLASECRLCTAQCQHKSLDEGKTPPNLLAYALKLLNQLPITKTHPLKTRVRVYEEIATAQLWMALTTADRHIRYVIECSDQNGLVCASVNSLLCSSCSRKCGGWAGDEPEGEGTSEEVVIKLCLGEREEKLMLKREVEACLSKAVAAWMDMWSAISESGQAPLDLQETFHQPLQLLHHMMLTAQLCSTHSQVSHY